MKTGPSKENTTNSLYSPVFSIKKDRYTYSVYLLEGSYLLLTRTDGHTRYTAYITDKRIYAYISYTSNDANTGKDQKALLLEEIRNLAPDDKRKLVLVDSLIKTSKSRVYSRKSGDALFTYIHHSSNNTTENYYSAAGLTGELKKAINHTLRTSLNLQIPPKHDLLTLIPNTRKFALEYNNTLKTTGLTLSLDDTINLTSRPNLTNTPIRTSVSFIPLLLPKTPRNPAPHPVPLINSKYYNLLSTIITYYTLPPYLPENLFPTNPALLYSNSHKILLLLHSQNIIHILPTTLSSLSSTTSSSSLHPETL